MTNHQQRATGSLEVTRPLTPNGNGVNLYLPPEFVTHLGFPLEPGGDTTAVTVPDVGVILFPGTDPDLPSEIDVRPADEYRVTTDTNTDSRTMIHTETADADRGDNDGA
ncbi:hypothetical protein [Natronorubrum daqingense]|uniref:Uncharacterized protein n=1 Tax=Natronorubrum daqingense TaxID=588898 RepID=A0A1N7G5Y9_9EURY|nr:hypothetical protein [Natronorubrum daqingense]APX98700.1 hypothetical protein BB347_18510 [Natronorubrum daqingense]SIS08027.1 hypothetical protein SAMN05421809_3759 [Natronorubrum daqingense]